jgi:VDE lipocalin domain
MIYYRGNNDAWKGYGGAVVYTRAPKLPQEYIPELKAAAEAAGLDWSKFTTTNNTCGPHPEVSLKVCSSWSGCTQGQALLSGSTQGQALLSGSTRGQALLSGSTRAAALTEWQYSSCGPH